MMENILVQLKAVADESRLKIIKLLLKYNYCVGELEKELGLAEAAVSHSLNWPIPGFAICCCCYRVTSSGS
jgi:DNA-binding transcriptional ArsR family regulator